MTQTSSRLNMLTLVMHHEWKLLRADRSLALVLGLLALMIGYGFYNGLKETQVRDQMVATVIKSEAAVAKANLESLRQVNAGTLKPGPFDNPANPATIGNGSGRHAVIHSAALAPIAIGQSDMMPNYYRIGTRSKVEFMYDSEIESPWNLLSGHFDLGFIMVFLLPLLIFALTYNLLSSEREAGTQRMLLSQPLSIGTLVAGKLLVRAIAVLLVASLLPIILLLLFRPEIRAASQIGGLLLWSGLIVGYGAFWFALAFAVNSLRLSSAANALILIASWTMLVLVVPVLLNLLAEQVSPAPSRTELAIQTRVIQADNLRRYDDLFSGDYRYIDEPESLLAKSGRIEVPERTRASFLARRDMDRRIDILLDRFDEQLEQQQSVVDRTSFTSPAIILYEGLTAIAGTDGRRYLAFRQDVSAFHDRWRRFFEPRVLNGIAMTEQDLLALPEWRRAERTVTDVMQDNLWRLALLLCTAVIIAIIGSLTLRRYRLA